ncbi:MAG: hypothetical protein AAFY71_27670 [Bacteroidota bacterium]
MSNKTKAFFTFFLLLTAFIPSFAYLSSAQVDSLNERANFLFLYDQYQEGISSYETLFSEGYWTEQSLYRLAFMHEQTENFPRSIFYLRKIQWEFGGEQIDNKIVQLLQKSKAERQPLGNTWSATQRIIHHNQGTIALTILVVSILLILYVFLIKGRLAQAIGIMATSAMLLVCLLTIANHSFVPAKAVLVESTYFYEAPGYAAKTLSLPLGPGTLVDLVAEQDIWICIRTGRFEAWVPTFMIEKI